MAAFSCVAIGATYGQQQSNTLYFLENEVNIKRFEFCLSSSFVSSNCFPVSFRVWKEVAYVVSRKKVMGISRNYCQLINIHWALLFYTQTKLEVSVLKQASFSFPNQTLLAGDINNKQYKYSQIKKWFN